MVIEGASQMDAGVLFHSCGRATGNAQLPRVDHRAPRTVSVVITDICQLFDRCCLFYQLLQYGVGFPGFLFPSSGNNMNACHSNFVILSV